MNGTRFEVDARYQPIKPVGKGAYGLVCSADDLTTAKKVAIKKVTRQTTMLPELTSALSARCQVPRAFDDIVDGKRILREIKLMKFCCHDNVSRRFMSPRLSQSPSSGCLADLCGTRCLATALVGSF